TMRPVITEMAPLSPGASQAAAPRRGIVTLSRAIRGQLAIPARRQAVRTGPAHSWAAVTNRSLITVAAMLAAVTHTGRSSTDGTRTRLVGSKVVPLTRLGGGTSPALRYSVSAAAACASR